MSAAPPTLDALTDAVRSVLADVPEVVAGWLFGSRARGTARDDSDLDVAILYRDPDSRANDRVAVQIAAALARATGIERIDVVDLAAQGPIFAHRVLCEATMVHESDRARRIDFVTETMSQAFDFMPTYRIATQGKAASLRRWLEARYDV